MEFVIKSAVLIVILIDWQTPTMTTKYSLLTIFILLTATLFGSTYPDISIKEVKAKLDKGNIVLLDANAEKRYNRSHVPTAISFYKAEDLSKVLPEDKDSLIVAYCSEPLCSAYKDAADAAAALGYTNVKRMSAGIRGWIKAGMEVEKVKKKPAKEASETKKAKE